jgi:hypothetical protein
VKLATLDQQIVSNNSVISVRRITSKDLAIKASQFTSNQNDACSHHLAMLVTSCWSHQAEGKGAHVYTVLRLLKTYLKPNIRWKHGFNSCDKGLTQDMVVTAAAVISTMQIVEYHV